MTKKRKAPSRPKKPNAQRPVVPEQEAPALSPAESAGQIREILDRLFDGNAEEIVKTLADSGELTPQELARMNEIFPRPEGAKKKQLKDRT